MANFLRLISGLLLGVPFLVAPSHATIAPINGVYVSFYAGSSGVINGPVSATKPGACEGAGALLIDTRWKIEADTCYLWSVPYGGFGFNAANWVASPNYCPANSALSGGSCACATGFKEGTGATAGQCVPKNVCEDKAGDEYSPASTRPLGSGEQLSAAGKRALTQRMPTCDGTCSITGGALRAERRPVSHVWTLVVPALHYSGAACSGSAGDLDINTKWDDEIVKDAEPPTPCPPGKSPGEINGDSVCVTSGATASGSGSSTSSTGTTATTGGTGGAGGEGGTGSGGDGSGEAPSVIGTSGPSNSSDTKITVCDGKTCTTTTTSTATSGGGTGAGAGTGGGGTSTEDCAKAAASSASAAQNTGATCTNTTTTTKPQGEHCKENPKDVACVNDEGQSKFEGNCAGGFTASGEDAVTNAMAKEIFTRNCQNYDTTGAASQLVEGEMNKTGNRTGESGNNSTVNVGPSSFDTTDALGGGSCNLNQTITVWRSYSVTLPFNNACDILAYFGYLLVAVGLLLAARIISRG